MTDTELELVRRFEFDNWKIESLSKAIIWLSARAIFKLEDDQVVFNGEDWRDFRQAVEGAFNAKADDIPPSG